MGKGLTIDTAATPAEETIAGKIIAFNKKLRFEGKLPDGFQVLNPYLSNPETLVVMEQFYRKFYGDNLQRRFLVGINPSRHGAGVTGVPFTDTKRLDQVCGIKMTSAYTHEISSVYMYDLIEAYGGAEAFYQDFYINSPFPLAIIRNTPGNQWVNANYYDTPALFSAVRDFMIDALEKHISLGLYTGEVFVLGKKNATFLEKLNRDKRLFERLTVLDHPRFIQQYKSKERDTYLHRYLQALAGTTGY
ncbi:SMUG2 DNA glycosylase family protein [Ravibacter arvi]|uniref:SMUG2 DNA glycosylase family protein n=1 Tax=Ravibacter arvi TaxID=2051041 RepID=A0ABP8LSJ1_9BACT